MIQSRGKKLWLCIAAVGIGLSLLVSGCGLLDQGDLEVEQVEELEDLNFLSIDLAQEELKGRVKRMKEILKEDGRIKDSEYFFTFDGLLERTTIYDEETDKGNFYRMKSYDEKGRVTKRNRGGYDEFFHYDDEKNQYSMKVNGVVEEIGDLDPQTKKIIRVKEEFSLEEFRLDSRGLVVESVITYEGVGRWISTVEYNKWGQEIYSKIVREEKGKTDFIGEAARTYENGNLKSVKGRDRGMPISENWTVNVISEDFDEHGNWRKRQRSDNPTTLITREIEYY